MIKFLLLLLLILMLAFDVLGICAAGHDQVLITRYVLQALLSGCLLVLVAASK